MDIETKREDQRSEAVKQKELMTSLIKHPGWLWIVQIAEMQIAARRLKLNFEPTENVVLENFMKGECLGIQTMIAIPRKVLDGATDALDLLKKEIE